MHVRNLFLSTSNCKVTLNFKRKRLKIFPKEQKKVLLLLNLAWERLLLAGSYLGMRVTFLANYRSDADTLAREAGMLAKWRALRRRLAKSSKQGFSGFLWWVAPVG